MSLIDNPYFIQWVLKNLSRMDKGLASKDALTYGATRMVGLSSPVVNFHNERLARDAAIVFTNFWIRISNDA